MGAEDFVETEKNSFWVFVYAPMYLGLAFFFFFFNLRKIFTLCFLFCNDPSPIYPIPLQSTLSLLIVKEIQVVWDKIQLIPISTLNLRY